MNTTPEQIADLTKAHTSAHQDLLNFASSLQTRMNQLEAGLIQAVPVGSLIVHAGQTPPEGYFECNGAAKSRTDYAALFAAIGTHYGEGDGSTTFNLPDLRGEFVRGWDHDRGVDVGRVFGGWQEDMFKSHTHELPVNHQRGGGKFGIDDFDSNYENFYGETFAAGGSETRPRNLAMIYCIRYCSF